MESVPWWPDRSLISCVPQASWSSHVPEASVGLTVSSPGGARHCRGDRTVPQATWQFQLSALVFTGFPIKCLTLPSMCPKAVRVGLAQITRLRKYSDWVSQNRRQTPCTGLQGRGDTSHLSPPSWPLPLQRSCDYWSAPHPLLGSDTCSSPGSQLAVSVVHPSRHLSDVTPQACLHLTYCKGSPGTPLSAPRLSPLDTHLSLCLSSFSPLEWKPHKNGDGFLYSLLCLQGLHTRKAPRTPTTHGVNEPGACSNLPETQQSQGILLPASGVDPRGHPELLPKSKMTIQWLQKLPRSARSLTPKQETLCIQICWSRKQAHWHLNLWILTSLADSR